MKHCILKFKKKTYLKFTCSRKFPAEPLVFFPSSPVEMSRRATRWQHCFSHGNNRGYKKHGRLFRNCCILAKITKTAVPGKNTGGKSANVDKKQDFYVWKIKKRKNLTSQLAIFPDMYQQMGKYSLVLAYKIWDLNLSHTVFKSNKQISYAR